MADTVTNSKLAITCYLWEVEDNVCLEKWPITEQLLDGIYSGREALSLNESILYHFQAIWGNRVKIILKDKLYAGCKINVQLFKFFLKLFVSV